MKRVLLVACFVLLAAARPVSSAMVSLISNSTLVADSFRPLDPNGNAANFVITARTHVDDAQPFIANTSALAGKVLLGTSGAGVRNTSGGGSDGISGGGGDKDEELIFTYDNAVRLDSISIIINKLDFGNGVGDKDDPVIFLDLLGGTMYEMTILEAEIKNAFAFTGTDIGLLSFSAFTSLPGSTAITGFKFRETNDHTFISGVSTGTLFTTPPPTPPVTPSGIAPIPEPATLAMFAVGAVFLGSRLTRRALTSRSNP